MAISCAVSGVSDVAANMIVCMYWFTEIYFHCKSVFTSSFGSHLLSLHCKATLLPLTAPLLPIAKNTLLFHIQFYILSLTLAAQFAGKFIIIFQRNTSEIRRNSRKIPASVCKC